MKIVGLIPARGGSRGIKNKNVVLLNDIPLICYTIKEAQTSILDTVYCSTDSNKIRDVCEKYGCHAIKRPKNLSDDDASMLNVVKHFRDYLDENRESFDCLMLLYPTYPFRTLKLINSAILKQKALKNQEILMGFHNPATHPYLCYNISKNDKFHSILDFDINKNYRRQDYSEIYELSHVICIIPMDKIDSINNQLYDESANGFLIDDENQILNIDTHNDLQYAEFRMKKECQDRISFS